LRRLLVNSSDFMCSFGLVGERG